MPGNKLPTTYEIRPIGILRGPYKEKFGIPRQSGLVSADSIIEMLPPYHTREAFEGIEQFSHLWIHFVFHQNPDKAWTPKVRPPRLGGNEKRGVFATRSPFRPNRLGLSVVRLEQVNALDGRVRLTVSGADLMDGTPIIDIKPYLPYTDCRPDATDSFAGDAPGAKLTIQWAPEATKIIQSVHHQYPGLKQLIEETLAMDPRPAYQQTNGRVYGIRLWAFDVKWQVDSETAVVLEVDKVE